VTVMLGWICTEDRLPESGQRVSIESGHIRDVVDVVYMGEKLGPTWSTVSGGCVIHGAAWWRPRAKRIEGEATVWVVGKHCGQNAPWEIQGVYTDEQRAVRTCTEMNFFVGPMELDTPLPIESVEWPGCYYPQLQEAHNEQA